MRKGTKPWARLPKLAGGQAGGRSYRRWLAHREVCRASQRDRGGISSACYKASRYCFCNLRLFACFCYCARVLFELAAWRFVWSRERVYSHLICAVFGHSNSRSETLKQLTHQNLSCRFSIHHNSFSSIRVSDALAFGKRWYLQIGTHTVRYLICTYICVCMCIMYDVRLSLEGISLRCLYCQCASYIAIHIYIYMRICCFVYICVCVCMCIMRPQRDFDNFLASFSV